MRRGLTALVAKARKAGVQRILLVGPVPEFPVHAPYCLVRALRLGTDTCTIARTAVDARRAAAMELLRDIAREFHGVRVIDPIAAFCTATSCSSHDGTTLFYSDSNHMSPAGIDRFFRAYRGDFEWAFGGGNSDPGAAQPEDRYRRRRLTVWPAQQRFLPVPARLSLTPSVRVLARSASCRPTGRPCFLSRSANASSASSWNVRMLSRA